MRDLDRLKCIQAVFGCAAAGPVGLISKRFNRPSNNRLDDALADRVIKILRSTYSICLWIPRKLRPPKIQQPRMRRACLAELIQIDGCEHHWFEDRGPACTALVFIDDATSA